jgi:acyl carrier protein
MTTLSTSEMEAKLREVLAIVQDLSGHEPQEITGITKPIGDLTGFDSLTGVETTTMLAERLGCALGLKRGTVNVFVSSDGCRALTVSEIANRLPTLLNSPES